MFVHHRTQGIILKKADRGEADQLFTVYTSKFGKISVMGRSIRKVRSKLRAGMDLFYLSEIEFIQGNYYKILTDALVLDKFSAIGESLERRTVARKMAECLDFLVKGQETEEKIWRLLLDTLGLLSIPDFPRKKLKILYYYFFWNLVSLLGYQPELFKCQKCKRKLEPEKIYFLALEGGMVCQSCYSGQKQGLKVTSDIVKIMRLIAAQNKKTLCNLKVKKEHLELLSKTSQEYLAFVGGGVVK